MYYFPANMLRFSAVMMQPGPGRDFGVYNPDISEGLDYPTIEDAVYSLMPGPDRVLPQKFELLEQNYDMTAEDPSSDIARQREHGPKMVGDVLVKREPKRTAKVMVDFDGTITLDPRRFSQAIKHAMKHGCEFHLVTGRPESQRKNVSGYCRMHGMEFSSMHFYPVEYSFKHSISESFMDSRIGNWKGKVAAQLRADAVIDDSLTCISRIKHFVPLIVALRAIGG